jgi:hypothetical protein
MPNGDSRPSFRRVVFALVACAALLGPGARPAAAQHEHTDEALAFDRPESWALKYFASVTLPSGLETPKARSPWSVSFGLDLAWIPSISETNRIVGFGGTKPEDLNKAPLFFRPRVTLGLPASFALTVAFNPPIETFGVTPKLLVLVLERPMVRSDAWSVGLRGYGQVGTVNGAYTCPAEVLGAAPGSPGNLYGCQAESSDTATLNYVGAEASFAHAGLGRLRIEPHAAIAVNYMNLVFQVDALTYGFEDHTRYTTDGFTFSSSAGVTIPLSSRFSTSVDVFYTPLTVQRPTGSEIDSLFNVRALFTYRLR